MLGPAHGVHYRSGLAYLAACGVNLVNLEELALRRAGNLRHQLGRVARGVFLKKLEHAHGIAQGLVLLYDPVCVGLESPCLLVVLPVLLVIAREYAVKVSGHLEGLV